MKLSLILALIPMLGLLMIAKFGAVLAMLAAFSPVFHLAAIWSFRHSKLNTLAESRPWSRNWIPAAVEMLVAIAAVVAAIHLQSQTKATIAWLAVIILWPPVMGIRLGLTAYAGGLVLHDYRLRIMWILSIIFTVAVLVSGIGIGVTTLAVIYQTNLAAALTWAIPGGLIMGGLALVSCIFINYQVQIVEGNLVWDIVNQHINAKAEAQSAFSAHKTTKRPTELPPIPLAEKDPE